MIDDKRDFKGIWIPANIYLAKGISWTAKILFVEIDSFTKQGKPCFMSNAYLANFLDISETQVSKHISNLIKLGWIEQTGFDGRKRYLKSCLEVNFNPNTDPSKISTQSSENIQPCIENNNNHTNTTTKTIKKSLSLWENKLKEKTPVFKRTTDLEAFLKEIKESRPAVFKKYLPEGADFSKELERYSIFYFQGRRNLSSDEVKGLIMDFSEWLTNAKEKPTANYKTYKKSEEVKSNKGFVLGQKHNAYG